LIIIDLNKQIEVTMVFHLGTAHNTKQNCHKTCVGSFSFKIQYSR
jgi:hypothetical protein